MGVVAAAKVVGDRVRSDESGREMYWDVEFLTPPPTDFQSPPAMPFRRVKEVTNKDFFWAKISKVPYLKAFEAGQLLAELKLCLAGSKADGVG